MSSELAAHSYGKTQIRLLRVSRQQDRHDLRDLTVSIAFEGGFDSAFTVGDNRTLFPADTMRNTVYVLARAYPHEQIEEFALQLAEHFLTYQRHIARATVEISEKPWSRLVSDGKPWRSAFSRNGSDARTTRVIAARDGITVRSGLENLVLMKTEDSSLKGFLRDAYTTLAESDDRILGTTLNATWLYANNDVAFGPSYFSIRQTLLDVFAEHKSNSLLNTVHAMGNAVLASFDDISEIHLQCPEQHAVLLDLAPFALDNPNVVFQPISEPFTLVEATLRRT